MAGAHMDTLPPPDLFKVEDVETKVIIAIVFASLSFVSSILVVITYAKLRAELRRPLLDSLVISIALAIPGSINFIAGAILRLKSATLLGFCSLNAYFFQQFTLVEIMMEGYFFAAIGWTLCGGTITYTGVRRALALFMIIGALSATIPMASLPQNPVTHTVWGSDMPWCWLPEYDRTDENGKRYASAKLNVFKFFFGYNWMIFVSIVGVASLMILIRKSFKAHTPLHSAIKWRFLYVMTFTVGWGVCLISRVFANLLSVQTIENLQFVLAVISPGMPFINAVIFFVVEDVVKAARWRAEHDGVFVSAVDSMAVDGCAITNEADASMVTAASPTQPRRGPLFGLQDALLRIQEAEVEEQFTAKQDFTAYYDDEVQAWLVNITDAKFSSAEDEERARVQLTAAMAQHVGPHQFVEVLTRVPKPPIGVALAFVGGFCDALSFVAVDIFSAHVTGNIVLIGVHVANKHDVALKDLLPNVVAMPVFAATIAIVYSLSSVTKHFHRRFLLLVESFFLLCSFIIARWMGPFSDMTSSGAYATGMLMVAGMAAQNCYQRTHLVGLPLTTFMTGNTNQIVHDIVDIVKKKHAKAAPAALQPHYTRLRNNAMTVTSFFTGAIMASLMYRYWDAWAFLPPVFCVCAILVVFWDETAMQKAA
jgi:uncharacterized membrane protein YoaK (UPF0700 family)